MKTSIHNKIKSESNEKNLVEYKPLIDLFRLLLDWHVEDVKKRQQAEIKHY